MKEHFTVEELIEMANDVNAWNGELEDLRYYENDEWFFKDMFSDNIDEAVREICYGNYNYTDDYVKWNAYGNLESCSEYEYEQQIADSADEIIDAFIRNIDNMWDKELIDKVKRLQNEK